jgi:hypothetical protein
MAVNLYLLELKSVIQRENSECDDYQLHLPTGIESLNYHTISNWGCITTVPMRNSMPLFWEGPGWLNELGSWIT